MAIVFPSLKQRKPNEGQVSGAVADGALSPAEIQLADQVAEFDPTSGGAKPSSGGADPASGGAGPSSGRADVSDGESCDQPHSKRRKYYGSGITFPANATLAKPAVFNGNYSYTKDALIVVGHVLYQVSKLPKKRRKNLQLLWVVSLGNRSVRMSLARRVPGFSRCRRERCKSSCNH